MNTCLTAIPTHFCLNQLLNRNVEPPDKNKTKNHLNIPDQIRTEACAITGESLCGNTCNSQTSVDIQKRTIKS